ncbi:DUF3108 domain-containing protein [Tropicimonas isoalkanivorans]|uniref:DUF3108 domain-containing protein n=1 Tax=Tropicimonas isoalkanivorans TaxID=441112 RepID=A0A1I1IEY7_9RHOB|nr:DUF3108 domain-containing protein [Tropicimonas isoalkanivorans]SFC34715.1 Protein of unknown function [Tropicimonas isoalkanivorans]
MRRLTALCLALALPASLSAQEEAADFDVSFAGIRGGTLSIRATEADGAYQAVGTAATSGLVGGLFSLKTEARASGRVQGNTYDPAAYDEVTVERGERKTKQIRFQGGYPAVTQDPPDTKRRSFHADGKDFPAAVDPMTGLYALLRARPAALACNLDISTYDGREVHRIRLGGGRMDGARHVCAGQYIRVAGYRQKDLADASMRDFVVIYDTSRGEPWPVVEVRARTSYGNMVFRRR